MGLRLSTALLIACAATALAQSHAADIRAARSAQNRAIAAYDVDSIASFFTEDVSVRRALGALTVGRDAQRELFRSFRRGDSSIVYQRITDTVIVSSNWPLAFESGAWFGHLGRADGPTIISGRYSAHWIKRDNRWRIRSEVFVALDCAGSGCARPVDPAALPTNDFALVTRVLIAEDRRDTLASALAEGLRHSDERIRFITRRAIARIKDPKFAARDSFPAAPSMVTWPEPAWRLRYRALANQKDDCAALRAALADSVWHVRLRAVDLATASCGSDDALVAKLSDWVDAVPKDASRRVAGGVSWHAAAHSIVALARLRPEEARMRIAKTSAHNQWELRMYSARAAALLADTVRLRALAHDANANVKEAAIVALSKLTGHADDDVYLAAIRTLEPQVVRVAAMALKGSLRPDVKPALENVFGKLVAMGVASERDARVAVLDALGKPASADRPPPPRYTAPIQPVMLAFGEGVTLKVTMSPASGGGSFLVRLRGDVAPIMAGRVLQLARVGYYDNGHWHRVEPDFVIQGGGPGTNEYVGHKDYIRDELGTIAHPRGSVGMSTRGHDTGDAQWFVNLKDNPRLMRDYTVFAEVVEGMDVVDGILEGDVVESVRVVQ